nr:MAG TPA: hypothetical protein [Caudoviricetes sp.]
MTYLTFVITPKLFILGSEGFPYFHQLVYSNSV